MKISTNMLKRYFKASITLEELAEITNEYISEVENYEILLDLENVVVGHVLEVEKHPNADKLFVCQVDLGDNQVEQIVCGAANVAVGQYVCVAKPGAILPGDFEIKQATIRGVDSKGMICSLDELGLSDKIVDNETKEGIYYFHDNQKIGSNAANALNFNQGSLELDLTPNRADLLSVLGFAYDLGAALDIKIEPVEPKVVASGPKNPLSVAILTDGCKRYYARYLDNVTVKPSPLWLQADLIASGLRPINNVVDVTNYVLLELGTPLHAFDAEKFGTNEIVVKDADELAEVITLDEEVRMLKKDDVVITNGREVVAIGGVMGLLNTAVTNSTTKVILEAASFDSLRIRETSKRLDLISDSSLRFTRGIDELRVRTAINRAAELLVLVAGARVYEGISFKGESFAKAKTIELTASEVNNLLGTDLNKEEVCAILKRLNILEIKDNTYLIPSYRNDLTIKADLIEEVARLYGYNNIPTTLPKSEMLGGYTDKQNFINNVRKQFKHLGFNEVINYSLTKKEDFKLFNNHNQEIVKLLHPLRDDRIYLRHSLINSLVDNVNYHQKRQLENVRFFEVGNIYFQESEPLYLGAIVSGKYFDSTYLKTDIEGSFALLKGIFEEFLKEYNFNLDYIKEDKLEGFHPGATARLEKDNQVYGFIGKIHPAILKDAYAFEVNLDLLFENISCQEQFKPISKYPNISRDIAVVVDKDMPVIKLENLIKQTARKQLINLELFDLYADERFAENKVSLAFRLTFNSSEKTLEAADIDKIINSIKFRLQKELNAEIR